MTDEPQTNDPFLYRFSREEKSMLDRRLMPYLEALNVVMDLHGFGPLAPLRTDPENTGFLKPQGVEIVHANADPGKTSRQSAGSPFTLVEHGALPRQEKK